MNLPSVGLPTISPDHNKLFEIVPRQINPKRHNDMPSLRNSEMLSTKRYQMKSDIKGLNFLYFIIRCCLLFELSFLPEAL